MTVTPTKNTDPIRWVAHRGYSSRYIENTLQAMQMAIAAGARYLEADIQFSADVQPMLFHDESLQRLCQREGDIQDYCSQDLMQLTLSLSERPVVTGIAHLSALLALLDANPEVQLFLEIKCESVRVLGVERCLGKVLDFIESYENQIIVISFSTEILASIKRLGYSRVAPVVRRLEQLSEPEISELHSELVFINYRSVDDWQQIKSSSISIGVYEVSSLALAASLWQQGVAFIETDAIGEMLNSSD